jgi:hypothetical protein
VEHKGVVVLAGLLGVVPGVPMSQMRVVLVEEVEPAILVAVAAKEDRREKRVEVAGPRQVTLEVWSKATPVALSQTRKER